MKTIGLIGGMSWESSLVYYKLVNEKVKERLGGFHSAKCILLSVDFEEIERLQHKNDRTGLNRIMIDSAQQIEKAGADFIVLCTNTMHLCSNEIIKNTSVPFIHIAQATAEKIRERGLKKTALLGTKFTMEEDFYKDVLAKNGIETIIPDKENRALVHQIIYKELVHGEIRTESRKIYQRIINELVKEGAEGIILGCTEIPLLIKSEDVTVPIFDTTEIHAERAVEFAINGE